MKILVTGFDPFGSDKINPAIEAVKKLPDSIKGAKIIKLEIPTVFNKSAQVVHDAIVQEQPDYVLNVGQAGGRAALTPERVAININELILTMVASPITMVINRSVNLSKPMATRLTSPNYQSRQLLRRFALLVYLLQFPTLPVLTSATTSFIKCNTCELKNSLALKLVSFTSHFCQNKLSKDQALHQWH